MKKILKNTHHLSKMTCQLIAAPVLIVLVTVFMIACIHVYYAIGLNDSSEWLPSISEDIKIFLAANIGASLLVINGLVNLFCAIKVRKVLKLDAKYLVWSGVACLMIVGILLVRYWYIGVRL